MTEYTTSSAGDRVAYDRYGSGPAIVFIAGAGPSRASDPGTSQTAAAAGRHGITTIVYDRLGRGESPAQGDLTLDRELSALEALLELAGGSAALCGHSSGCTIALAAAVRGLPVTGLLLWEAPLGGVSDAKNWSVEFGRLVSAGELEQAQMLYMKDMPPEWLDGARRSPAWPAIYGQAGSLRADAESIAWAESAPLAELLRDIAIPVEVAVGRDTLPIMTAAAAALVAAIPGAESVILPGADHSWDPLPMAEEVARFVRSLS
ncbi:alpha/beta fold hydrolase [Lysinimonas soli]|uniref:Alpha/beta fold hydrolase n=1 Tax=Lysinimonas soli TaxID=1074233 RepID=A0ABW0NQL0_9MICO